jgi:predicted RNA-binding Zn ribbon-like protein
MSYSLARYVSSEAPDGLALVQGLLNTRGIGEKAVDLLADQRTANRWLREATAAWARKTGRDVAVETAKTVAEPLDRASLVALVKLRNEVLSYVTGEVVTSGPASLSLLRGETGDLRLEADGVGIARATSTVWLEIFLAQQNGTLRRLKLCRNQSCGSAFYDRSKNSSAVWHDVGTCGNRANLKASRARRRMGAPATIGR